MVTNNVSTCPDCGNDLNQLGCVKRIVRTKRGNVNWVEIRILSCSICGKTHRELPDYLIPYKHYEIDIIRGVVDGTITSDDLDYEDYPCEMTMKRWKKARDNNLK